VKNVPVKPLLPGWGLAPKTPVLSSDEVHVWSAKLDQTASRVHNLQQTLDGNERARTERFYLKRECFVGEVHRVDHGQRKESIGWIIFDEQDAELAIHEIRRRVVF
jgi:hypothetical protein